MIDEADLKTTRRVTKNGLAMVVRFAATTISRLFIVIVIARWKGVQEVGDFSFVMNFTLAFTFLNDLGLTVLLMREVARERERIHEFTENALTVCVYLGVISILVMGGMAYLLGYRGEIVTAIFLTAIALVLDTLGNIYVAAFSGYERMELGALAIVIQEGAFLVIGIVVLYLQLDFLWIFVIFILSRFISLIASAQIFWKFWHKPPRLGFNWSVQKVLLKKTLPFAVNTALSPVYARIDMLMLSYIKGNIEVGYYEVASTLFYRFNVLARFYNLAIMPLIANEYPVIGKQVVRYVKQAVKYQIMIGAPITALSLLIGGPLIIAVYGSAFNPTVLAFQIMATAITIRLIDHTLGITLAAIDLAGLRSVATGVMAVFNILANVYAIPRYGFLGAAATSVLTEVGYFIIQLIFVRSRLPNPFDFNMIVRPTLAALIMAAPIFFLGSWSPWLLLPLGLVFYGIAAYFLRVITPSELQFIFKVGERLIPSKIRRRIPFEPNTPK